MRAKDDQGSYQAYADIICAPTMRVPPPSPSVVMVCPKLLGVLNVPVPDTVMRQETLDPAMSECPFHILHQRSHSRAVIGIPDAPVDVSIMQKGYQLQYQENPLHLLILFSSPAFRCQVQHRECPLHLLHPCLFPPYSFFVMLNARDIHRPYIWALYL